MRAALKTFLIERWSRLFPPKPYRHILASLPDPAFAIDLRGRVIYWNRAIEQMTGVLAKDILGQGDYAYSVPFYGHRRPLLIDTLNMPTDALLTWYPQAKRQGDTLSAYAETNDLRGAYGYLSVWVSPIYDRHGRRIGAIEQVRDETALRQSEEMVETLSLAVAQSPNGTFITDAEGRFKYVNGAFEEMYGYTANEVLGARTQILSSGMTPSDTIRQMWESILGGRAWQGEFINKRKDGEVRAIFSRVAPIRQADGRITRYLAIQEDTTERKKLGQELDRHRFKLTELVVERTAELARLKEAAESASEAKSAFLANMSHEIRTPMNGIIGLTRIVYERTSDPDQRRHLGRVMDAAQSLLQIINDILDLSKIEANKLSLDLVSFYLQPLLSRQMDMVRVAAESKGIRLSSQISPALLGPLLGDPLRIGQVLLNFLGNAVKFTSQGEVKVLVSLSESETRDGQESLLVLFEVIDTGIGIAPGAHERLFKPFEQVDASITREFGGTGLGLAISQHLAEMMGGGVGVDSQEGQGSRFWFTVRLVAAKGQNSEDHQGAHEHLGVQAQVDLMQRLSRWYRGARILLVEDNEVNQEVALSLLEGTGFAVDVAENGAQALQKARAQGYDLILMDVQMPVMDGLTATRLIRGLAWHRETPILAMTANVFDEDRRACLAAGMNEHIGKPIVPAALYRCLQKWLDKRLEKGSESGALVDEVSVQPSVASPVGNLPQTDWVAALRTTGLVNVDAGLASTGGREKMYLRVLRRFLDTQSDACTRLSDALARRGVTSNDHAEAVRLAHSLKGLAATLGFSAVQEKAAALELALKSGDETPVADLLLGLMRDQEELVAALRAALPVL